MTFQSAAEEKKILELIVAASEEFLQSAGSELNYQKITDNILNISGAKYAGFDLYDEDGTKFTTVALSAPEGIIKKVYSLLGFKLLGKKWDQDSVLAEKIKLSTITHFATLSALTGDVLSRPVVSLIEKTLGIGEVLVVKILKEKTMIGNFTLVMPKNISLKNDGYVEIYTRQVGLLIARSRGEVKLIESEMRLRSVFAAVSDPIFLLDQETGDILDVNDAACSLYGYSRDEILLLKNIDISAEPDKTRKALKDTLTFVPLRYHKKKDGTIFPAEITASSFELNGRKVVTISIRDITGRKIAEESLRKSEEKFSKAFHSGAVLMAISTVEDGCYIDVNDAFLKTLGFKREEVIGRTSSELDIFVDKKQREAVKKLFYEKGRVSDVEVQVKGRDGIVHTGIFTVEPIDLEDKPCWLTTLTEITERKKAEENLKNNSEALQNILKGTNVGTWEWNVQTGETRFNARSAEILGYTLDEISPCNIEIWERFAHPGDFKKSNEQLRKVFAREIDYQDVECRMKHKDGSWVWIQDRGKVISWTPDGKPLLMSGTYTEITGRKKAEEVLRVERERLANILEGTNAGTWEWNFQTGELILNARSAEIIGYTLDEISPINAEIWERFAHPEDLKKSNNQLGRIFAREIDYYDGECRMKHKDGSWVWLQDRGKVISWTPDGKPLWISGTYIDITERKRVEETLEESRKTTERYLNIAAEIIVSLDTLGNIALINSKGHQLLGYNHDELIGKNWFKTCLPHEMASEVASIFEKLMNGDIDNTANYENPVKTKSGDIKTILWHNTLLKDSDGNVTGIISSGEDITDRKKAEEEIVYLSFHDHLTGLYNRRFFEEELKRLDTERQLPLSFVMGDLNGLKLINDVFGHTEGDKLLKETAEILRRVCRSDDILTRWGGDEFVLLLPKTSASDAEEIVERIKKECKKTKRQKISISLSLGTAIKETAAQDIQIVVIDAENNMYKNKLVEKESLTSSIIFALEQALYEKSNETKEHTDRIHDLAIKLGKSVKLSSRQLDELSLLAALHDIGKVAIPENILLKKSALTEKEWVVLKRHPEIGFNIAQSSSQIAHIAKPILYCHENWDGSGYPMGIAGESIPVISRIILIADAYDVMTSRRTYKLATSKENAVAELKRCAGSQFDPALVDKFIEILAG